ncbi:MAG: response regulator [Lachnospiraceae bacterium]|nr:response regulator [Lachnospiraceae bacterium]
MKVLIVEDEPLVLIGIKTLLQNSSHRLQLCQTASNGCAALEIIEQERPEIVITDIRMPKMDGLELIRTCRRKYGEIPVFIILTNYEEFHLAKEALTLGVIDYLVKLELTADTLDQALQQALHRLNELAPPAPEPPRFLQFYKERFFIRLLNNLFENEEQFQLECRDLGLSFEGFSAFVTCYFQLSSAKLTEMTARQQMDLYASSLDMLQNILPRYHSCYCVPLDARHLAVLFLLPSGEEARRNQLLTDAVGNASAMLKSYYGAELTGACGTPVISPLALHESFQAARHLFTQTDPSTPFLLPDSKSSHSRQHVFNMSLFKDSIARAYEEYDAQKLSDLVTSITDLFAEHPDHYVQAMDAASNILYLSLSLISDGETVVSSIFSASPAGYRSLYSLTTAGQVMDWLRTLCDGLCHFFEERKKDYKNHIVSGVRRYIQEHVEEKLSLNEVAAAFGISPSYLSLLFKKYSDCGFSEYVSQMKISRAKELIQGGTMKIYEIADQLGFENAFYFSKVFKKVEGCSPRDYQYQCCSAATQPSLPDPLRTGNDKNPE